MKKFVKVDESKCVTGHICPIIKSCPKKAINHLDISKSPTINYDNCVHCGVCVKNSWCGAFYFDKVCETC